MTISVQISIFLGAMAGLGVFLVVRGLAPSRPALDSALDRLHAAAVVHVGSGASAGSASGSVLAGLGIALSASPLLSWIRPPVVELRLIGQSIDRYLVEKLAYSLLGLLMPLLGSTALGLLGIHVFWVIPTIVALGFAAGMFFLVDVNIRQKADIAREEFRRVVATYLTLVGLVRYGGAGAVESLESAASVGDGWVFDRIRAALTDARYANEAPWARLRQVSVEIGVPDLGDVGDIMSLVGDQGAQVYETLLARAQSLRVALRTKEAQRAAAVTTLLYVPTSMLLMVLLVLIGYPAISRIIG
jgi:type II secretion system (T2SS) protein F